MTKLQRTMQLADAALAKVDDVCCGDLITDPQLDALATLARAQAEALAALAEASGQQASAGSNGAPPPDDVEVSLSVLRVLCNRSGPVQWRLGTSDPSEALDTVLEFISRLTRERDEAIARTSEHPADTHCANCHEPWASAGSHLFGQMYDGEWVCSAWCEDCHEWEGCPGESPNPRAEQAHRLYRRLQADGQRYTETTKWPDEPTAGGLTREQWVAANWSRWQSREGGPDRTRARCEHLARRAFDDRVARAQPPAKDCDPVCGDDGIVRLPDLSYSCPVHGRGPASPRPTASDAAAFARPAWPAHGRIFRWDPDEASWVNPQEVPPKGSGEPTAPGWWWGQLHEGSEEVPWEVHQVGDDLCFAYPVDPPPAWLPESGMASLDNMHRWGGPCLRGEPESDS